MRLFETFFKDLRLSLRVLRKNPAFTIAALAALTLGIGANTAIFSVVNAVLLRPVAVPDPDRLVLFMNTSAQNQSPAASPAKFMHWRSQDQVVEQAAVFNTGIVNLTGGAMPEQLRSGNVSVEFFRLFGAPIEAGRTFSVDEDLPGGERVVVLSRQFWERRYNSDRSVVGQTISLSGEPHLVIGVLGNFTFREFGPPPEVWLPFRIDPNTRDQGHYFQAGARLKPGVSLEQAKDRLNASAQDFRVKFPQALPATNSFSVEPIRNVLVQNVRPTLYVMLGAVALVLLIACANVANLLLARATGRTREMAVRAAMGGSRGRILRQLLTESLLLSVIGGALGLTLGVVGMRALLSVNTANLPRVGDAGAFVSLDWRVVAFTIGVSIVTGVLFGLLPALQTSKTDLTTSLKEASGRSGTGRRQNIARATLVIVEVALALILLVGSALLIRTALALARVDPGFDSTNVLTMRMSLSGPGYAKAEAVALLVANATERLNAIPGVEISSATCCVPLQGGYGLPFVISGRPLTEGSPFHGGGAWMTVSPGYFEVFKIPIRKGRTLTDQDRAGTPAVVVINEAMAREFFPDSDPLEARITIGRGVMREFAAETERQIVGVIADSRDGGLNQNPAPRMFVPQSQLPDLANALNVGLTPMAWVVRTKVDPLTLSNQIQESLRQSTGLPVSQVRSMSEIMTLSTSRQRFNMLLMTTFGVAAMLLAGIGIYGLMAYSVAQRKQEIGIRLALGAQTSAVRKMVIFQGMRLAVIGVIVGLGGAFALTRFIAAFLFQVQEWDPVVFTVMPITLLVIAFLAVAIPAMRAARVDPLTALRYE